MSSASRGEHRPQNGRRGAMVVLVVLVLVLFFMAAAFSVNVAYMMLAAEQLHAATDAAAKAAVVSLSQGSNQTTAINNAISYAAKNAVCGAPCTITAANVTLGSVSYSASGTWAFNAGGTPTSAAQVSGSLSLPLFFAPVLGIATCTPAKTSTSAFVRNKWCLVFDHSGSMCFDMSGTDWSYPPPIGYHADWYPPSPYYPDPSLSRLANLNAGATIFLNALTNSPGGSAQNVVGMISFADAATTNCAFTSTYSNITTQLNYYITTNIYNDGIYDGGTDLSAGLQAALNLFTSSADGTPWNQVIIVFSDGEWNEGANPLTLVPQLVSAGITVHTIGLLQEGNNTTMQQLAAQTGGQFFYATNSATLQAACQQLAETIPVILTQ